MSQIGSRLRKLRTDRGLTQEALARLAGVTLNTVVRAELGTVTPSQATLLKLGAALGVHLRLVNRTLLEVTDEDSTPAATTA